MKCNFKFAAIISLVLIMLVGAAGAAPFVYVTNEGEDTEGQIAVIDAATNEIVTYIPVGYTPMGVTVNPSGTKVYAANQQSYEVSVIDAGTNTVESVMRMRDERSWPKEVVVSPNGQTVYVISEYSNTLKAVDTVTNEVVGTVRFPSSPRSVVISPDGNTLYALIEDGTVFVVDAASFTQTGTIVTGIYSFGMGISPDGDELYVTHIDDGILSVIDVASKNVVATLPVGSQPKNVAVSPDGRKVYIVNTVSEGTVTVFDPISRTVTATFPVGSYPQDSAVTSDGRRLYVVQRGGVAVIDANTGSLLRIVDMPSASYGIAVGPGPVAETPAQPVSELKINDFSLYKDNVSGSPTTWEMVFTNTNTQEQVVKTSRTDLFSGLQYELNEVIYYDVTYRVWDSDGNTDEMTKNAFFAMDYLHAGFTTNVTQGRAPLTVKFTNDNERDTTLSYWDLGDGVASEELSPVHTYGEAGTYNVRLLKICDSMQGASYCFSTQGRNITVIDANVMKPEASFVADVTSGNAPLIVRFTDTSSNSPTKWTWVFGDGASSKEMNPAHTYNKAGKYSVVLVVSNDAGKDIVTMKKYITVKAKPAKKPVRFSR